MQFQYDEVIGEYWMIPRNAAKCRNLVRYLRNHDIFQKDGVITFFSIQNKVTDQKRNDALMNYRTWKVNRNLVDNLIRE